MCEDVHLEAAEDLCDDAADFAGADDAGGFAAEVESHEPVEGEIELADAVVGAMDFAVEGEEECDGVFCNGVRGVIWDTGDEDAELACGFDVEVIEAGAAHGDVADAGLGEDLEGFAVCVVVDEDASDVGPFSGCSGIGFEAKFKESPVNRLCSGGFFQPFLVVGFCVKDNDGDGFSNKGFGVSGGREHGRRGEVVF